MDQRGKDYGMESAGSGKTSTDVKLQIDSSDGVKRQNNREKVCAHTRFIPRHAGTGVLVVHNGLSTLIASSSL